MGADALSKRSILSAILVLSITHGLLLSCAYNPIWVVILTSSAIAYGALSTLVAARRLYFLAGATPHAALFAVILSLPLTITLGIGTEIMWSTIIGVLLIYIAGYAIHRGINSDIATSVFVAFTASGSVLAGYYVLTRYPVEFNIASLIIGDPLLTGLNDAVFAAVIASATFLGVYLTYREQISLGIDRDSAYLSGINAKVYDLLIFTLLGVVAIGMLRIVGYVLEHILILLPSSIALTTAKTMNEALEISIITALTASLIGLHIGIILNLSPAGLTGLVLLTYYIVSLVFSSKR